MLFMITLGEMAANSNIRKEVIGYGTALVYW